jgi:aldehyde:ferredoxin oxidoreductase
MISYDYEPIYALGSMLGISDARGFLKLMDRVEAWGLDAMSTGVVLAWATEARERGLISEKETMGTKLGWGDSNAYIEAVGHILKQPNQFYKALCRGVEHAASLYGGKDFALALGTNEMPGYHTGPGAHIGVLIGTRHSHLDNAGYSIDQKVLVKQQLSPAELVENLLKEERWRQILSSLVICFFARGIYGPDIVLKTLGIAGFELNPEDLSRIDEEIHREKYRFKTREGFSLDNLRLPKRIFETPSPINGLDEKYVRAGVEYAKKVLSEEGPSE